MGADYVNAALSAAAMVPFLGMAATGTKWVKRGVNAVRGVARHADEALGAARFAARNADEVAGAARAVGRNADEVAGGARRAAPS